MSHSPEAMKKEQASDGMDDWVRLFVAAFPELIDADDSPDRDDAISYLAFAIVEAHRAGDSRFLRRGYHFVRWTLHHSQDSELLGDLFHSFFDHLLYSKFSKSACVDYLDWGDVQILLNHCRLEPSFTDEENFAKICHEWQKRWSQNRKLPIPETPIAE
jgi:hypothetical protein